jgi:4'-phosphopantetheinyl transferase
MAGCSRCNREDRGTAIFAAQVRLRSLPESRRTEGFFNCWTRKEAFVKACGGGLSLPLDAFDVSLAPDEAAIFLSGGAGWSMQAFHPCGGLHAAMVMERSAAVRR